LALIRSVSLPDIGRVDFHTHPNAKRIILSVKPFENIRVSIPQRASVAKAESFVLQKKQWIMRKQAEMLAVEQQVQDKRKNGPNISRKDARKKLVTRLKILARKHNFRFEKVFIRNQKTRWGSCSSKNNINLNYHLALIPEHLMDYVLLHELVHTRIKNHSPQFWNELSKYVPNPKKHRKALKKYQYYLV
jgi:hypothetical protein